VKEGKGSCHCSASRIGEPSPDHLVRVSDHVVYIYGMRDGHGSIPRETSEVIEFQVT